MKKAPASILAAAMLLGGMAATSVAQEFPREANESQQSKWTAASSQRHVATVDDMGITEESHATQTAEVEQLRTQVDELRSLCAHMYEDVHNRPADVQEIQFASMLDRLETGKDCLTQPYVSQTSACCEQASPCCETSCCQPCCEPCCCQPCSTCYAGFAFLFVKPHFHEDTAFIVDPAPDNNNVRSFQNDYQVSPRVWLGWNDGCSGAGWRATYWTYDYDADPQSILGTPANTPIFVQVIGAGTGIGRNAFADDGELFVSGHSLQLDTFDLEATKRFGQGRSYSMAGLGLRYANMEQEFTATVFDGAVVDEQVIHRHDFEGIGPTLSYFFHQQFGQSNWGFYGNARGSVLFGDRNQSIYEVKNAGANIGHDYFNSEETMTIAELGFGLQYSRAVNDSRTLLFLRGGYEGQVWFDAGGPLSTTGDMGLEGFVLGFGIEN